VFRWGDCKSGGSHTGFTPSARIVAPDDGAIEPTQS